MAVALWRAPLGSRVLVVSGALLLIDLLLPWERAPTVAILGEPFGGDVLLGASRMGFLVLASVAGLLAWEGTLLAGTRRRIAGASPETVSALLGAATVALGAIRFVAAITGILYAPTYGAWIGLLLLAALGYGTFLRFQERRPADALAG